MPELEVIVTTLADAIHAEAGGATSVEIITNPALGGLTPALDVVRAIVDSVSVDTHVIIRAHADSFVYSSDDKQVMLTTIRQVARLPLTSIVIGGMLPDGDFDFEWLQIISNEIEAERITIHRVIDHVNNPFLTLSALNKHIQRVLCSGAPTDVYEGRYVLRDWIQHFGETMHFKCGGGLTFENIQVVHDCVHAPMYHVGAAARTNQVVDKAKVAYLRQLLAENQKGDH